MALVEINPSKSFFFGGGEGGREGDSCVTLSSGGAEDLPLASMSAEVLARCTLMAGTKFSDCHKCSPESI
jgi:hypothetical protein